MRLPVSGDRRNRMSDPLLCSVDDGVAVLTFNRPDAANAWSAELHLAYLHALRELAVDSRVRAVVVTGAGRHFCVGADMSLLDVIQAGGDVPDQLDSASFLEPIDFPKPLIAAINGSAAGIGLIHALLADIRFAVDTAVFTTAFSRLGLVAEHGASWLLPQIVGRGHALDLLLSSRRVGALEAERMGLVHRVYSSQDLLPQAITYARNLAENSSPAAIHAMKYQVTKHATMHLRETEAETVQIVAESLEGADFKEGVRSFVEQRPAKFAPLGKGTLFSNLAGRPTGPDAVAEAFFAATARNDWDAALALLSPQATVCTYPGPPPSGVAGLAENWQKLRDKYGPWEYLNVRRLVSGNRFCEQHLVRFPALDFELEACVVATLDEHGLIVHLEEYADGAALRAAGHRCEQQTAAR
jgi:enoyl-CoA hydratase/carnithine racemase